MQNKFPVIVSGVNKVDDLGVLSELVYLPIKWTQQSINSKSPYSFFKEYMAYICKVSGQYINKYHFIYCLFLFLFSMSGHF